MVQKNEVAQTIYSAIDDVNRMLAESEWLEKSFDTALFGQGSALDSMGFVNLVVAVERKVEENFGIAINLINEHVISQEYAPLQTVGTLADYLSGLIEERTHG